MRMRIKRLAGRLQEGAAQQGQVQSSIMELTDLPDDVLHGIFSFLPLKNVLQMEHLCKRLHYSITGYLYTLKSINLYYQHIKKDMFRYWHSQVRQAPTGLLKCLERCPLARRIAYLPHHISTDCCRSVCHAIKQHHNPLTIDLIDSKEVLDEVLAQGLQGLLREVTIVPWLGSVSLVSKLESINAFHMEDANLDPKILSFFSNCHEMNLVRCLFTSNSDSLKELSFPFIKKFLFVEEPGNSSSAQTGSQLISRVVLSKSLKVLHVGLQGFSVLEKVSSHWLATGLRDLEITSTGSYSAALQQLKFAVVVAEICDACRGSLQRVCLPSTILVKQFFDRLILRGHYFPELETVKATGYADTRLFLSPGNMVKALYYQEFLKLCPQVTSLSLHSFSDDPSTLAMPLFLSELVLPWDNRLNPEKQKRDILATLSSLPQLRSLSIYGVEEVDVMIPDHGGIPLPRHAASLEIAIESLQEFKLKNVSVQNLDLTGCRNLSLFSIHCCPTSVSLPIQSLQKICIYAYDSSHLLKLLLDYLEAKSLASGEGKVTCHIHAQLHSLSGQEESDVGVVHEPRAQELLLVLMNAIEKLSKTLDFLVLKDDTLRIFEHNSGEPMFPFTEYSSHSSVATARSKVELLRETSRRNRILEGIGRWKNCIEDIKGLLGSETSGPAPTVCNDVAYCDSTFKCFTNLKYLPVINADRYLCQPSGSNEDTKRTRDSEQVRHEGQEESVAKERGTKSSCSLGETLNIPYFGSRVKQRNILDPGRYSNLWDVNSNPLVLISIIEYVHCIHTLFYYD